jgi:hypothetical protein
MEKKKKSFRFPGWKPKELIQFGTIIGAFIWGAVHIEQRFESIDHGLNGIDLRLDGIDLRLNAIEARLNKIQSDLRQTSELLNTYLTWRFLYIHDPGRRDLEPLYDPNTRTLKFVEKERKGK